MDKKLDNFESFIKNSMDNHEASYSSDAWNSTQEAMNSNPNGADGFESFVKKSLDNHEATYTSAAWKSFALLLGKTAVPFYKTKGFIAAISAVVIAGVVLLSLPNDTEESNTVVNNDTTEVKVKSAKIAVNKTNEVVNTNNKEIIKEDVITTTEVNVINTNDNVILSNNNADNIVDKELVALNKDVSNLGEIKTNIVTNEKTVKDINSVEDKNELPITRTDFEKHYIVSFDAKLNVCEGEVLNLTPREINKDLSYKWLLNDKVISNESTARVTLSELGENNIDLIAYLQGERVSSRAKAIHVMAKPKADIVYQEDKISLVNSHSFKTNSEAKAVAWNFGDGETSNELKANHSYKKQGKYTLNYSITNNAGCNASYSKNIIVKGHYNIRPDHGFSPDGDGSLDMFLPEELKLINQPFEMIIYSRNQEVVFKTNNVNNSWNGRDLEGNMVPFGVYVWIVNITNDYGQDEVYKGSVTKASN